jgi:hypothetical protein
LDCDLWAIYPQEKKRKIPDSKNYKKIYPTEAGE